AKAPKQERKLEEERYGAAQAHRVARASMPSLAVREQGAHLAQGAAGRTGPLPRGAGLESVMNPDGNVAHGSLPQGGGKAAGAVSKTDAALSSRLALQAGRQALLEARRRELKQ